MYPNKRKYPSSPSSPQTRANTSSSEINRQFFSLPSDRLSTNIFKQICKGDKEKSIISPNSSPIKKKTQSSPSPKTTAPPKTIESPKINSPLNKKIQTPINTKSPIKIKSYSYNSALKKLKIINKQVINTRTENEEEDEKDSDDEFITENNGSENINSNYMRITAKEEKFNFIKSNRYFEKVYINKVLFYACKGKCTVLDSNNNYILVDCPKSKSGSPYSGTSSARRHCTDSMKLCTVGELYVRDNNLQRINNISSQESINKHLIPKKILTDIDIDLNAKNFRGHFSLYLIRTFSAFTTIEDPLIIAMANQLQYPNVSDKTIAQDLSYVTHSVKEILKEDLASITSKISIIIDVWTSPTGIPFLGIKARWINDCGGKEDRMLDLVEFVETHSGQNIAKIIEDVVHWYGIQNKLSSCALDNGANGISAVKEHLSNIGLDKSKISRCAAHILNRVFNGFVEDPKEIFIKFTPVDTNINMKIHQEIKNGRGKFKQNSYETEGDQVAFQTFLTKIHKFAVKWNKHGTQKLFNNLDNFKSIQVIMGNKRTSISIQNETRWNSAHQMGKDTKMMKPLIEAVQIKHPEQFDQSLIITNEDWITLDLFLEILAPLESATLIFSNDETLVCDTIPTIIHLIRHYENLAKGGTHPLINNILYGLQRLYKYYFLLDECDYYYTSTILKPSWVLKFVKSCWEEPRLTYHINNLEILYLKKCQELNVTPPTYTMQQPTNPESQKHPVHIIDIDSDDIHSYDSTEVIEQVFVKRYSNFIEVDKYLNIIPTQDKKTILWWSNIGRLDFPILYQVSRDLFGIAASSCAIERSFSTAGNICTNKRNALSSDRLSDCVLLSEWIKQDLALVYRVVNGLDFSNKIWSFQ